MLRKLKPSAFGIVTVVVLTGILCAQASAEFESESEIYTLTTSSNAMQKIAPTAGGTAIECTKIGLGHAWQTGKSTISVRVPPSYSSCETFLGAATSVNTNGCEYHFILGVFSTTGTMEINCPSSISAPIEIKVGSICKYTITSQSGLSWVSFKNTGSGTTREIIVEPNVSGITSTRTTNDFFCPAGGSTGTYTGNFTLTGENSAGTAHIGVFVD